ncbi:hypothetical protein [Latilactobacillus curvatus]|uniref:hypothetical protein n=1 Tax=Latilactobacillus curvatus TaxID=28038 RepID=UPI00223C0261|nr:hypothetical protein [Latilactobacillus curvatus]MCS8617007.1 hypothetical protein [Latilactobacillus curvatus]
MTNYTIKDLKKWLKKKYPHIYYSANINFAADSTPVTEDEFKDFKNEMNKVGQMNFKIVKVEADD